MPGRLPDKAAVVVCSGRSDTGGVAEEEEEARRRGMALLPVLLPALPLSLLLLPLSCPPLLPHQRERGMQERRGVRKWGERSGPRAAQEGREGAGGGGGEERESAAERGEAGGEGASECDNLWSVEKERESQGRGERERETREEEETVPGVGLLLHGKRGGEES